MSARRRRPGPEPLVPRACGIRFLRAVAVDRAVRSCTGHRFDREVNTLLRHQRTDVHDGEAVFVERELAPSLATPLGVDRQKRSVTTPLGITVMPSDRTPRS